MAYNAGWPQGSLHEAYMDNRAVVAGQIGKITEAA
jgi:hypothetical protein